MKKCIRCSTEIPEDSTLCEDCQDHKDAQDYWHKESLDDLFEEW